MATRSFIIVYAGSTGPLAGNWQGIYVHNDGSPEWQGKVLQENYASFEAAHSLIELGRLSLVRETPETCDAYARDWGRPNQQARVYGSILEAYYDALDHDADYVYIWNEGFSRWQLLDTNPAGDVRLTDY